MNPNLFIVSASSCFLALFPSSIILLDIFNTLFDNSLLGLTPTVCFINLLALKFLGSGDILL